MAGKDPEREFVKTQQREQESNITLREFFPQFMQRHGAQRSAAMQESYKFSFKNICRCAPLADVALDSITRKTMLDYMHARKEQDDVTNATVNREAAFVKILLRCAVDWESISHNPLAGMKLFKEADKREVLITTEQAEALIKALPYLMANIVEFAIYSGFRKENILGLRIEDVNFHDAKSTADVELVIKGGRRQRFMLGELAVEVIKRVTWKHKQGFVFLNPRTGTRYKSIHKTFNMAVKKVGLIVNGTKFRFHDLRHVFATWLHQAGVSLDVLRPLMGHRDRATTDRYASLNQESFGTVLNMMPRITG
jgi:integrase